MSDRSKRSRRWITVALAPVVDAALPRRDATTAFPPGGKVTLPSREAVIQFVEDLRAVLFPGYFGTNDLHDESLHYFVGATLARAMRTLEEQIRRGRRVHRPARPRDLRPLRRDGAAA